MPEILNLENEKLAEGCETKGEYFRKVLTGKPYVLCMESAAEFMSLTDGNFCTYVDVYKLEDCVKENVGFELLRGIYCTTVNQTINDILENEGDPQILMEALSTIYERSHYEELDIFPQNQERFDYYKQYGIEYYCE